MGTPPSNVKVIFWNAQSICSLSKSVEFFSLLNENCVDIGIVTESWLKHKNKFYNENFVCHRSDRADGIHGGVALVVKKTINHKLMPQLKTKIFETISVKVFLEDTEIVVIGAYFPGGNPNQILKEKFIFDLNLFNRLPDNYIITGDFNCRHSYWGCTRANTWGNLLFDKLATSSYELIAPSSPTHFPRALGRVPSTIDLILTNYSPYITPLEVLQKLNSDHLPVLFTIRKRCLLNPITYRFVYNKANWTRYGKTIKNLISLRNISMNSFNSPYDIDCGIKKFVDIIEQAKECAIPKKATNNRPPNHNILPFFLKNMIQTRNSMRRRWQRSHNPVLKRDINYINKLISDQIIKLSNEKWSSKLQVLEKGSKPFWNLTKILKKRNKNIPPIKTTNGTLVTNKEKADEFAKFFALQHQNVTSNDVAIENLVSDSITNLNLNTFTNFKLIRPSELSNILKSCKNNKAPGPNGVSNILLKNLPKEALIYLTQLLNACLKISYFPDSWKEASVVCVPKPNKNACNVDGYRPISLLDCIGKIFERCIKSRINCYVETAHIIPDEQFGFRAGHSTCHQLLRIKNLIKTNFENKKSSGMIVLDVQNAFNSVWHDGLIHKMITLGFPMYIVKIIKSFLDNRKFRVAVKGVKSDIFGITAGVPQGSTLSPSLYNIFTSDMPTPQNCELGLYADDTAIVTTSESVSTITINLKNAFNTIFKYFTQWKIKINASKTQAIFFSRKRKPEFLPNSELNLNGQLVPWNDSIKYLGLHLDKKLTFKTHIDLTIKKCDNIIKLLYPIINRKSKLSNENKILIFKVVFQCVLLYGSPVWGNCAITHRKRLQVKQNKILKMTLDLPWFFSTSTLHEDTGVRTIFDKIQCSNIKFQNSCAMLDNPLISDWLLA